MKTRTMAQAFNEWMYRYINDPEGFEREFESVLKFCEDKRSSREPDYGRRCEAYLKKLMSEPASRSSAPRRRRR